MNDILLLQLEHMTPVKWISLITNDDRLFQSVTILINIGIKQLFTEEGAVILQLQCPFGKKKRQP